MSELTKTKPKSNGLPWIEKYRPTKIEDLVVDQVVKSRLKKYLSLNEFPDILIAGVPGIGKTTTILCLANIILGPLVEAAVLELNASDDRGIKTVEREITNFCKKKITFAHEGQHKIVLLDEMDNMTTKAQQKVNILMNTYHKTTRFAFTCNDSTKIIEGIQSNCSMLRYKRVAPAAVVKRLKQICVMENVEFTPQGLKEIAEAAAGDLRQAVNNLQLVYTGFGKAIPKFVRMMCDKPNPDTLRDIFLHSSKKNLKKAMESLEQLLNTGYSHSDLALGMMSMVKTLTMLPEPLMVEMTKTVSQCLFAIGNHADSRLQLSGCVCELYIKAIEYDISKGTKKKGKK